MSCAMGYATALLDIWVRQRQALTLEQAVHKLTAVPAALFGIPHRGTLAVGNVADLVLLIPRPWRPSRQSTCGISRVRVGA